MILPYPVNSCDYSKAYSSLEFASKKFTSWLQELSSQSPQLTNFLSASEEQQKEKGYYHTLQEIFQQPFTWLETAVRTSQHHAQLKAYLKETGIEPNQSGTIILTGSGSSLYAGECLALGLQEALGIPVQAVPGGNILTHTDQVVSSKLPYLVVSFARSGNSPESCGAVDFLLTKSQLCHHLTITCNQQGKLAIQYKEDPRVLTLVLDDKTCDRSLVMTSSFTNMVLAAHSLAMLNSSATYLETIGKLAQAASYILSKYTGTIASIAAKEFKSAIYLGSGDNYGAARETALKMLEMTSAQISTFPETFLGLRHGPMSAVHSDTLIVCFLSSDSFVRNYELDLIQELNRKKLGVAKVIIGESVPEEIATTNDVILEVPGLKSIGDENAPVLNVLVGQLLAFFSCLKVGLKPDSPSASGVINRVVENFKIHKR